MKVIKISLIAIIALLVPLAGMAQTPVEEKGGGADNRLGDAVRLQLSVLLAQQ